ncbi:MAG: dynamin family protein [Bacillota bacterium]
MNTVTEYINRVKDLCGTDPERESPAIFVAGPVNAGKSTLVNSLLDQRICPADPSPSSFFPVYFRYSETPRACQVIRGRSVQLTGRELKEALKKRKTVSTPERAEIFLPAGILRWCSLVDTPGTGLSSGSDDLLRDCLSAADGIIFLFHQRGIDAATHRFLTGLAAAGMRGWISFWINSNLGLIDGTSLTETSQALRTIFPGRAQVYAINTMDRSSVDLLSLFLQVKALESAVRGIETRLSRWDRMIPGMLERASIQDDEERFLLKFWDAVEQSEVINAGTQAVKDLPLMHGSLVNMLRANTCRLINETSAAPARKEEKQAGPGPGENIACLVREIGSDRDLARYINRDLFKKAADSLDEKFRVMVAGPFSTGKTTFLNALLGETLLPAEDRATTSCAVRIRYGSEKTATVEYLFKAEFFPVISRGGKYALDRREMTALTQLLDNPALRKLVSGCEVCREGLYKSIPLSQLAGILDGLSQSYGRDTAAPRIPLFSRRITDISPPGPAVTGIRITPGSQERLVFHLDDDRQRLAFYKAISPPASYLVDNVVISYPSENLVFADFIDTPGLDSLHQRHYDRALRVLSRGDLLLVFLHAKHLLSEGMPGQVSGIQKTGLNLPVIYVINFADTVSDLDRERVSLYIRQKLGRDAGSSEIMPYPQVYAISALNALRNGDEGFDRLLRRIRKKIEEIETRKITLAAREIRECLEKIAGEDPAGQYNIPARARQAARRRLEELARMEKRLLGNGVK